ncbi:MAG: ABC transporter permease [Spirochaetota bacterium]
MNLMTLWQRYQHTTGYNVILRLLQNKMAISGLIYILLLIMLSLCAPLLFDYEDAIEMNISDVYAAPSLKHPLGADEFGRDILLRLIFGARVSLLASIVVTFVAIVLGGFFGILAGYYRGLIDTIIMRFFDILYAIPAILLAIAIIAAFGANLLTLVLALSISAIPGYARIFRASVLEIAHKDFVEAIQLIGAHDARVLVKHLLPNIMAPIIVRATLGIGIVIISVAGLSYLGLGVQPPAPEWGRMLAEGQHAIERPLLTIIPGLAIISVVLAFNFLGDGLRDALDPKLK